MKRLIKLLLIFVAFQVAIMIWGLFLRQRYLRQEVSDDELIALVKDKLGGVKAPKTVDIMEDLPRSAVGKVLKTELRKPYWEDQGRNVS